jgi:hypothetical protein
LPWALSSKQSAGEKTQEAKVDQFRHGKSEIMFRGSVSLSKIHEPRHLARRKQIEIGVHMTVFTGSVFEMA